MSDTGFYIDITDEIDERLSGLFVTTKRRMLERAINNALDAQGWPRGERGAMNIPASYWFVVVWDRHDNLRGHVGPIHGEPRARVVAQSWQQNGSKTAVTRKPIGTPLTNPL